MPLKGRLFAQLEAVQYWMRRDPTMQYTWQMAAGQATAPDGRVIDLNKEFPKLNTWRTPGPWSEPIDEDWITHPMVGVAAVGGRGLAQPPAMTTLYPVEFVCNQAGTTRNRSGGPGAPGWKAGLKYVLWLSHQARTSNDAHHVHSGDEAVYARMPGVIVVVPGTAYDAKGLMMTALAGEDPVVYVDYGTLAALPPEDIPDEPFSVPFGKAALRQEGKDLTLAYWGEATTNVVAALPELAKAGISVEAIDIRSLKPFDDETLIKSVTKTKRLLVVSNGYYTADFSAHVVAEAAANVPGAKFYRMCYPDCPSCPERSVIAYLTPNAPKIVERAKKLVG